ncbi:unnamed protein product [Penicillium bialowiezense]
MRPFCDKLLSSNRDVAKNIKTSQDPLMCRQIIAGVAQCGQTLNVLSPHESRAVTNRRLEIAFGIDNSFTRPSSAGAASFVRTARGLINLPSTDWLAVSYFAKLITKSWCTRGLPSLDRGVQGRPEAQEDFASPINVASMVQVLTLRVALLVMFDKDKQETIRDLSILNLAQSINRIWIASKNKEESEIPSFEEDAPLQQAVVEIFGAPCDQLNDNPMNLIVPSFETMWRVVLRAVLEIGFVRGKDHPEWKEAMVSFAMNTNKDQFERHSSATCNRGSSLQKANQLSSEDSNNVKNSPSAEHLVMECLRLYVPTRRIHRAYRCNESPGPHNIHSADIEGCHLRRDIWGDDANSFNPDRWLSLTPLQKQAFMPFGSAPFECPAKPTFGPRMIGLLAGAVLAAFDDQFSSAGWSLECEDGNMLEHLKSGERLSMDRTAYANLYLVEKK